MFEQDFIKKFKKMSIFIIIYSLVFFFFIKTLNYTIPFVLALTLALMLKPLKDLIMKKFKASDGLAAGVSTMVAFLVVSGVISLISFKVVDEFKNLTQYVSDTNIVTNAITQVQDQGTSYARNLDPAIVSKVQEQLTSISGTIMSAVGTTVNKLLSFAVGVPTLMLVFVVTFVALFFLLKDLDIIYNKILSNFSLEGQDKVKKVLSEVNVVVFKYIKAYSILLGLTFTETLIGFSILGIDYSILLSLVAALVDFLPLLGVGFVYVVIGAYYFFTGSKIIPIGLAVLYLIVVIVRQVVEPKLVSNSLGIHPLLILIAIFVGLKLAGIIGMLYLVSLILALKIAH